MQHVRNIIQQVGRSCGVCVYGTGGVCVCVGGRAPDVGSVVDEWQTSTAAARSVRVAHGSVQHVCYVQSRYELGVQTRYHFLTRTLSPSSTISYLLLYSLFFSTSSL